MAAFDPFLPLAECRLRPKADIGGDAGIGLIRVRAVLTFDGTASARTRFVGAR